MYSFALDLASSDAKSLESSPGGPEAEHNRCNNGAKLAKARHRGWLWPGFFLGCLVAVASWPAEF